MMVRQLSPSERGRCCLVAAVLVLAAGGCGKPAGNISGKVTYQGNALPAGYVNFSCEGDSPTVKTSTIQSDGSYSISAMPVGPAKITVQGITGPQGPGTQTAPGGTQPPTGSRKTVYVPPQYANTDTSQLTWTVVNGSQTYNIELK
jgi:hypothetical protein